MTIPKNKGLRKITLDNNDYYWKVDTNYEKKELTVAIGKISEPSKRIILSARHVDFWIDFPHKEETKDNEIDIVTPKLINRAIKFAIKNGWESQEKTKTFKIKLANNSFELIE